MGITQIMPYGYSNSLKEFVDGKLNLPHLRTTGIGPEEGDMSSMLSGRARLTEEERDGQIKKAIVDLLGNQEIAKEA